jgi:hypothetical protein
VEMLLELLGHIAVVGLIILVGVFLGYLLK